MNLIRVNAKDRFLSKLAGVSEPEKKRKIIGEEFIRVFEEESQKLGKIEFLCLEDHQEEKLTQEMFSIDRKSVV